MEHTLLRWIIGLLIVSGVLGAIISYFVWKWLHNLFDKLNKSRDWKIQSDLTSKVDLLPILTGIIERLFFTILIAFDVSGASGAAIVWIGTKMAAGWGAIKNGTTGNRALAFVGLIASLTSMLFALLGGLICKGDFVVQEDLLYMSDTIIGAILSLVGAVIGALIGFLIAKKNIKDQFFYSAAAKLKQSFIEWTP